MWKSFFYLVKWKSEFSISLNNNTILCYGISDLTTGIIIYFLDILKLLLPKSYKKFQRICSCVQVVVSKSRIIDSMDVVIKLSVAKGLILQNLQQNQALSAKLISIHYFV